MLSTYVSSGLPLPILKILPFDLQYTMKPPTTTYQQETVRSCLKGKNVDHHKLSSKPIKVQNLIHSNGNNKTVLKIPSN